MVPSASTAVDASAAALHAVDAVTAAPVSVAAADVAADVAASVARSAACSASAATPADASSPPAATVAPDAAHGHCCPSYCRCQWGWKQKSYVAYFYSTSR